jgi:hypothetical protein
MSSTAHITGSTIRVLSGAVAIAADAALGVAMARAGTRVASASVTAASAGATLVVISELGSRPLFGVDTPRRRGEALRSGAGAIGWSGLAWSAATLAEDRNLNKAPLGPALAALQGLTLITGSSWPNRLASGTAQIATGLILSGAAARHDDPTGGAIALTSSAVLAAARVTGFSHKNLARSTTAVLDAAARIGLVLAAARLSTLGDESLF